MIKLKRPLCFIDLETTGVDKDNDRIVEIAICKLHPDGKREVKTRRINPTIPIPTSASEVHGIYDVDVENEPKFKELAKGLHTFIDGCDVGGFNSNRFDFPLLLMEFHRAGITWDYTSVSMVDVGNIYVIKEPRTLSAAHQFYIGTSLEGAHAAEVDINATVDIFLKQYETYPDLPKDIEALDLFCNYDKKRIDMSGWFVSGPNPGQIIFAKGKWSGNDVNGHLDYIGWMYNKVPSFPPDVIAICKKLLKY